MQPDQLQELTQRLNQLIRDHKKNREEIVALREELRALHAEIDPQTIIQETESPIVQEQEQHKAQLTERVPEAPSDPDSLSSPTPPKRNLEAFVGGNLIAKVGIVILVLGLGYLVKFAIDNALLGPAMRVSLGFLSGLTLVGIAYWLKDKYRNYSGILLGGGLAILYFSAYSAFSFYELIPQGVAFALMLIFTLFGVAMAYLYDVQAIGIFGLVGAYAVPPLLSDGSGEIQTMFVYMFIINLGVLGLAFRKDWRVMNAVAFVLTWLIYAGWYVGAYEADEHFGVALGFGTVFFLLFYAVLLAYKIGKNTTFSLWDVSLLLLNAFFFFGFGYAILEEGIYLGGAEVNQTFSQYLGLFTVLNAALHFGVASFIYRKNLADHNLFYFVAGLVLTFLTIAIPVQLEGNWVTFLWIAEACLLAWIGRQSGVSFYKGLAIPLAVLAVISWGDDVSTGYAGSYYTTHLEPLTPIFNIQFLTTLVICGGLSLLMLLFKTKESKVEWEKWGFLLLGASLLLTSFFGGMGEISHYFYQRISESRIDIDGLEYFHTDLKHFRSQWLMYFALGYMTILGFLNIRFWRNRQLNWVIAVGGVLSIGVFVLGGLAELANMRRIYLTDQKELFDYSVWMMLIRYIGYLFLGACLYMTMRIAQRLSIFERLEPVVVLAMHAAILTSLCFELEHLALFSHTDSATYHAVANNIHRVGYSVLWGVYGLFLMILGFRQKKSYLRIGAIVLLGFTLLKVFFSDMAQSSVGSKVIVFVSLGILLLLVAFLYQRFKDLFEEDHEEKETAHLPS